MNPEEEQPEHQAVNIAETEEEEKEEEEEEYEEEVAQEVAQPQQAVVLVKHKDEAKPVEEIQLKPTSEQADALATVLKVLKALTIDEVTFSYNGNISLRIMDASRVSMVDAQVDMGFGLESLVEVPPVKRKFTCNVSQLARALRMDKPTFNVGQCEIACITEKIKTTIPILEDNQEDIPEPKVTLDVSTNLDVKEVFTEMTKYLGTDGIPQALSLVSENGKLTAKGSNEDLQKFEMSGFTASKDGKAIFSTKLLQALKTKNWAIIFANDLPLKASVNLTQTHYANAKPITTKVAAISVWLAPRIEEE